ncbi:TPA: DUF1837 domain-containing protein [Pseudomonas putida]|nr:DUF1837 domain-containing protein [Pseudomonas putida]
MDFEVLVDCDLLELHSFEEPIDAENKKVLSLANDFEDGKWRSQKFHDFIWDNMAETSLTQRERESLAGRPSSILHAAAQNLRLTDSEKDVGQGSELAEIVLYGIMKHKYGALPVVPKIFYKQNVNDFAKGADSVHIVVKDDDFTLWFGEAKFYKDVEDARLASIVKSVANSLDTAKLKKENAIICNVSEVDYLEIDPLLGEKIKNALSNRNSIDSLKPRLNIPILLLHECSLTREERQFSAEYKKKLTEYHANRALSYFSKQLNSLGAKIHLYEQITFHVILFPVPDKKSIVKRFVRHVQLRREDD